MQSKTIVSCVFAAAILATTPNIASARAYYLHGHAAYRTSYHHRIVRHAVAWQVDEAHGRYGRHGVRTVRATASYGDAYSGIASVYSASRQRTAPCRSAPWCGSPTRAPDARSWFASTTVAHSSAAA
jgi:hypothetical protein